MREPTTLYLVRHAESHPSKDVPEPEWPLSPRGIAQAEALAAAMRQLDITLICSSPYPRAVATITPLAGALGLPVRIEDALHERVLSRRHLGSDFLATVERYWADPEFALSDGESNRACRQRVVAAVERLVARHPGETIAIATHGNALALYMGAIDPTFGFEQWRAMQNPDLFRVVHDGMTAAWDGTRLPTSA